MDCSCEKQIEENQWPTMKLLPQLTEQFQSDFGDQVWFSDEEPDYGELPGEIEVDQSEEDELAGLDEAEHGVSGYQIPVTASTTVSLN